MSKVLYNRSRNIQYLKRAVPPGSSAYYRSSIALPPKQSITVSDEDFAAMTVDPDFISVTFVADDVINTAEEVQALITASPTNVADAIVDGVTTIAPSQNAVFDALVLKVSTSQLGAVSGVATLDGSGKIPLTQMPPSIVEYKGTWDASTNTPVLADGVGVSGYFYRVNVAGTQNLGSGSQTFVVNDWVVYNGTIWQLAHAGSDTLQSVYNADPDGSGASIVTNAADGSVIISGDQSLQISATGGLDMTNAPIKTTTTNQRLFLAPNGNGGVVAESSTSTAVGNARGTSAVDLSLKKLLVTQVASGLNSAMIGGANNTASGQAAFVGGGETNISAAPGSAMVGGTAHNITSGGQSAFIGGGETHLIGDAIFGTSGGFAAIIGGNNNTIYGNQSVIAGGSRNLIYGSPTFIGSGLFNISGVYTVTTSGSGPSGVSGIGTGDHCFNFGSQSYLGGGAYNQIARDGVNEAICGGALNATVSTQGAFVGGGLKNIVTGTTSTISGGSQNNVTGNNSAIGGGVNNVITVGNSFMAGSGNWATSGNNNAVFGANTYAAHGSVAMFGRGAKSSVNFDLAVGNDSGSQTSGTVDAVHFRVAGDTSSVHIGRTTDQPLAAVAQTATLTIAEPAVFTVATAPADGSTVVLTSTGTLPANFTQPVIISTTIDPNLVQQRPYLLPRGTAVFTFAVPEKTRFTFSQLGSFYDVVGAGKAIQLFDGAGAGHYFWFKVGTGAVNVQTNPVLTGTAHQVTVLPADTSAQVATKFYNAFSSLFASFNAVNTTASRVDISNMVGGPTTDATVTGTAAALSILVQGSVGTPVANGAQAFFPTAGVSLSNAGYPAGVAAGTNYYVVNSTGLSFNLALTPGGTPILVSGFQDTTSTVGGNIGAQHNLTIRGLQTAVRYFVVNSAGTTFNISYAVGGPAIPCYGSQTGVHTVTTQTFNNATAQNKLHLYTTNISNQSKSVSLKAPSLTANVDLTLPNSVGSANQLLTTDGAGLLSWSSVVGVGAKSSATDAGYFGQLSSDGVALFLCTVAGAGGAATWMQATLTAAP